MTLITITTMIIAIIFILTMIINKFPDRPSPWRDEKPMMVCLLSERWLPGLVVVVVVVEVVVEVEVVVVLVLVEVEVIAVVDGGVWKAGTWQKRLLQKRRRVGRLALWTQNQRVESRFCRWVAGQCLHTAIFAIKISVLKIRGSQFRERRYLKSCCRPLGATY